MKQVRLERKNQHQVVWVDKEDLIKKGSIITLKGEKDKWRVKEIYPFQMERNEINRTWHVGGL